MQLVLSNNRIIAHGENFLAMGGVVINTETGARYENATIAECEGCPSDINEVGYEYHAGVFVPCAPYGKAPRDSKLVVACESCATIRTNDTKTSEIVTLQTLPFLKTHAKTNYSTVDMAVGDGLIAYAGGTIEISTNDFDWQLLGTYNSGKRKIAVGNGIIACIEVDNNIVYYSNDNGVTWNETNIADTAGTYSKVNFRDIAFGNGIFVAIEGKGTFDNEYLTAHYSTDCINWQRSIVSTTDRSSHVSLEFFEGKFYLAKKSGVMSSVDGSEWDYVNGINISDECQWNFTPAIAMGNGKIIYMHQMEYDNGTYFSSCGALQDLYHSITFGGGVFVAVGTGKFAYSLDNGTTWATGEMPEKVAYDKVIYTGDKFLAAHSDSSSLNIAYSTNGISWTVGGLNFVTADKEIITGQVKAMLGIGNTEIVYNELAAAYNEGVQEA